MTPRGTRAPGASTEPPDGRQGDRDDTDHTDDGDNTSGTDGMERAGATRGTGLQAPTSSAFVAGLDDPDVQEQLAIPAEKEPPAVAMAMAIQRSALLRRALDELSERERIVVTERFSLLDERVPTLDELSQRFGVSIERIRQIESAAVKKLGATLTRAGESAATLL